MADTYLTKTYSTAGNQRTFTFSAWVKRSKINGDMQIFGQQVSNYFRIMFRTANSLRVYSPTMDLQTEKLFMDTSGWYHIVVAVDTTQAAGTDRCKIYINGDIIPYTSGYSTETYPNQNDDLPVSIAYLHKIGAGNSTDYFDGIMSHIHFCDGTMYNALTFGSTDATTGAWKINTAPSVTYGDNGFFILKDGNSVTDQSGEGNNWAVLGTALTNTEDNPSDVFDTLNPLNLPIANTPTLSNGNTTSITSTDSGSYKWGGSTTLGMTKGKFYCEAKATVDGTYSRNVLGVTGDACELARGNSSVYGANYGSGWYSENGVININGSTGYTASTYTTGDILSIAIDLDNLKLYYAKNGTWENSGDPTSGATGTGALTLTAVADTPDGAYFFCQTDDTGTTSPSKFEFNFGNGYFGTTAISSEGTNASNIGKFEYDVPTGYTALSTKGLNE